MRKENGKPYKRQITFEDEVGEEEEEEKNQEVKQRRPRKRVYMEPVRKQPPRG